MTAPSPDAPRFTPVADHALLVEFAEAVSDPAHDAVVALDAALPGANLPGFRECVPAYVSLLVAFDPQITDHHRIETAVRLCLTLARHRPKPGAARVVQVCYDDDLAPDLAQVARLTGLTPDQVIAAHLAASYSVAMYGFAPGYAYLAGVAPPLHLPRKPAPIRNVPAGSVIIAGAQCLVTTLTMPTGWWIIGRSRTRILTGNPDRPFLFDMGDSVTFQRIGRAEYERADD